MSSIALESKESESTWYNPIRETTKLRYKIVIEKVNKLMNIRVQGMRPNYDDVLQRVHEETGYSVRTIENIMSRNRVAQKKGL